MSGDVAAVVCLIVCVSAVAYGWWVSSHKSSADDTLEKNKIAIDFGEKKAAEKRRIEEMSPDELARDLDSRNGLK